MSDLTHEHFAALQGERFFVHVANGDPVMAELIEARILPSPPFKGRQPFSLLFKGPSSPRLPQSTYQMMNDNYAEPLNIFLVPVGVDASGACYEAVFN